MGNYWPLPVTGTVVSEGELLDKALSLVELGQHEQALQTFTQVIERNPMKGSAWLGKGLLLMNAFRRFDEALVSLEHAQKLGEQGLEEHVVVCRRKLS